MTAYADRRMLLVRKYSVGAYDYVLWAKHTHGNTLLQDELLALEADTLVWLDIRGVIGTWVKMNDSKTGEPTPVLKALGIARDHWHRLFREQRGAVVTIRKR